VVCAPLCSLRGDTLKLVVSIAAVINMKVLWLTGSSCTPPQLGGTEYLEAGLTKPYEQTSSNPFLPNSHLFYGVSFNTKHFKLFFIGI
jgi:hypothetical protein